MTSWPGRSVLAEPIGITTWPADGAASFRMAMSNAGDRRSTRAVTVVPSMRRSLTNPSSFTTCTLVMMVSGRTKKPLPRPEEVSTRTTAGITRLDDILERCGGGRRRCRSGRRNDRGRAGAGGGRAGPGRLGLPRAALGRHLGVGRRRFGRSGRSLGLRIGEGQRGRRSTAGSRGPQRPIAGGRQPGEQQRRRWPGSLGKAARAGRPRRRLPRPRRGGRRRRNGRRHRAGDTPAAGRAGSAETRA